MYFPFIYSGLINSITCPASYAEIHVHTYLPTYLPTNLPFSSSVGPSQVSNATEKYRHWQACAPCQLGRYKKTSGNQERKMGVSPSKMVTQG